MATKRPRNNAPLDPGGGAGAAPAPAKRAAGVFAGAIVVTYRHKNGQLELLVGRETNYLREIHTGPIVDDKGVTTTVAASERIDAGRYSQLGDAKSKFIRIAKAFSTRLGQTVLVDIPEKTEDGTQWKANFRITTEESKFGFVKGHRKGLEEPLETITREFREETGVVIDRPEHLVEIGDTFPGQESSYKIFVNHAAAGSPILSAFRKARFDLNYGELTQLQFRPLSHIWGLYFQRRFNSQTRKAIEEFFRKYFADEWAAAKTKPPVDPTVAEELAAAPGGGAGAAPGGAGRGGTRRLRRNRRGKTRRTK